MFEPFQQFVRKAANQYNMGRQMDAAKVCHDFRALIPELFGDNEALKENIKPASFKEKVLVINVTSPGWAQEVIIRKPKIIEEMNKKAGKEVIKNLRTQLKYN